MYRNWLLILILIVISYMAQATELYHPKSFPKETHLEITKARWDSFDVFELGTENHQKHQLICGFNSFYEEKRNLLHFQNYYGITVASYELSDYTCVTLFRFLQGAFEGVDKEHPIKMILNNTTLKVEKIFLPPLNPLQNGSPTEEDPSRLSHYL